MSELTKCRFDFEMSPFKPRSLAMVRRIKCAEIWGGIHGDELPVETSGVRACLFSRVCEGGKGGDIYYFSAVALR